MALTPTGEAKYALDYGVSRSDLSLGAQIEYDRLVAEGYGTPPPPPQTKEDRKLANQARREENRRKRQEQERLAARTTRFPHLGVAVRDGCVYGVKDKRRLAGAHVEVVDGKLRNSTGRVLYDVVGNTIAFGPLGLLLTSTTKYKGFAVFTFPQGSSWEIGLADKPSRTGALAEAVRFNALAASAQPGPASGPVEGSAEDGKGVAAELERLTALHGSGGPGR